MAEKHYTAQNIADICGLSIFEVYKIKNRGYFNVAFSEENPNGKPRYNVIRKRLTITPSFVDEDRNSRGAIFYFNQEALETFLEGVKPNKDDWPSAYLIEQGFHQCRGYVSHLWRSGAIRGRTSLIRPILHVHPEDTEILKLDRVYGASKVAHSLRIPYSTLSRWNNRAPTPFFKDGTRVVYIPPQVFDRLKRIRDVKGKVTKESLSHLYNSENEFNCYLKDIKVYNPDSPPYFKDCHKGQKIYYFGRGVGEILEVQSDTIKPTMTARFKRLENFGKEVILILSNRKN